MAPSLKKLLLKVQRAASVDDLGPLAQQLERNATMMALVRRQTAPGEAAVQQGLLGAVQRACELVAAAGFAPAPALACGCLKLLIDGFCDVCASPLPSATRELMKQQLQSGLIDAFAAACSAVGDALSNQHPEQHQQQVQQVQQELATCLLDAWSSIRELWGLSPEDQWQACSTVLLPSIAPVAGLAVAVLQHSSRTSSSRSSAEQAKFTADEVANMALCAAAGMGCFAGIQAVVALRAAVVVLTFAGMVQMNVCCSEAQDAAAAHAAAATLMSHQVQLLAACTTALVAQHAYQQQHGRAGALQSPAAAGSSRASSSSSRGRSCSEAGHGRANSGRANSSSTSQGSTPPKHHELLLSLTGLSGLQLCMGPQPALLPVPIQLGAVFTVCFLSYTATASGSSGSSSSAASPEPHNGLVAPLLLPLALTVSELMLLEPPSLDLLVVGLLASQRVLEGWRQHQMQSAAARAAAAAAGGGCAEQASADDGVTAAAETGPMQQLLQLFQTLTSQQMGAALFSVADEAGWRERVLVPYGYVLSVVCQSADDLEDWTDDDAAAWQQAVTFGSSVVEAAVRALAQLPEGDADNVVGLDEDDNRAALRKQLVQARSICRFVLRCWPSKCTGRGSTGAAQAAAAQQQQQQQQMASLFCSFMKVLNAYLSAASDFCIPAYVLGSVNLGVQDVLSRISASSSSDSGGGGEPSPELLLMLLGRALTTAALALRQAMALQPQPPVATDEQGLLEITIDQLETLQQVVSCVLLLLGHLAAFVPNDMRPQLLEQQAALEAALGTLDAGSNSNTARAAADSSAAQQESPLMRSGQLADALQAFSAGLCSAAPVRWCCNNPACRNLTQLSELQLVSGKSSVCSGCIRASYCSAACQKQHWTRQGHKPVCKAIQQQRQQMQQQAAAGVQAQQQQ